MPREQILRLHDIALDLKETARLAATTVRRERELLARLSAERQFRSLLLDESQQQVTRSFALLFRSREITRQLNMVRGGYRVGLDQ